jgi:phosphonate transport system permease protein
MATDATPVVSDDARSARFARWRRRVLWLVVFAGAVALYVHAWSDTHVSFGSLVTGYHGMADIIRRSYPPSGHVLRDSIRASIVTFDTALLGTTGALVFSVLLAPLAARNVTPNRFAYEASRVVIGITRAIPDLIWALLFVTAVGLGPFAGVLALTVHSIGTLGKLFAETIEDMDMGPVDALRVSGASRTQVFLHSVLPGVSPTYVSLTLYRFDVNFRSSLVLGFVGAGGIGFLIFNSMQLFQYREVATELGVVLVLVLAVERLSTVLRSKIV